MLDESERLQRWLTLGTASFYALTVGIGLLLRWDTATAFASSSGANFAFLRHAHSHAGFYGVLTLCWWEVERRQGTRLLRGWVLLHMACALLAALGFAWMGYRAPTIALSTVVAGLWLRVGLQRLSALRGPARPPGSSARLGSAAAMRVRGEWLDATPFGLIAGVALIPAIAVTAKRDFMLSRDLAHVFVCSVLFTVFVPAAFQALGYARRVALYWYVPLALVGAARVVFGSRGPEVVSWLTALLALLFATCVTFVLLTVRRRNRYWYGFWVLPAAIVIGSFVPSENAYSLRIAGIHLLILGPVLTSLLVRTPAPAAYVRNSEPWTARASWLLHWATLLLMVGALVLPSTLLSMPVSAVTQPVWRHDPIGIAAWACSIFVVTSLGLAFSLASRRLEKPSSE
ncbi:MAG TPA: hypothetical protein VFQ61_24815 [Polyangiaceae bacterium]|nr:hypothetical protein [Polyangiaceae bacterium]